MGFPEGWTLTDGLHRKEHSCTSGNHHAPSSNNTTALIASDDSAT